MNKKKLNTLVLVLQWLLSFALSIYLLVPVYTFSTNTFVGDAIYSPYDNWRQVPLQTLQLKGSHIVGTQPDSLIVLNPFLPHKNIYLIDTLKENYFSPFLLGHSRNDIQFLLKRYGVTNTLLCRVEPGSSNDLSTFKGIGLYVIDNDSISSHIDAFLENGNPAAFIADQGENGYAYNLVMASSPNPTENLEAILAGRNLLVFSKQEIFREGIDKIPVIRTIEWENNTLKLDLSEKGEVRIISPGISLDTLVDNISLSINNPLWFRFEVRFPKEDISYISNAFFKYTDQAFDFRFPKTNNQLTIFINLSWLIGMILLNIGLNRFRKRYL